MTSGLALHATNRASMRGAEGGSDSLYETKRRDTVLYLHCESRESYELGGNSRISSSKNVEGFPKVSNASTESMQPQPYRRILFRGEGTNLGKMLGFL